MSGYTVNCGCGRTMTLDARQGRGVYRCGCGARIRVVPDALPDSRCVAPHNSQPCRLPVTAKWPFPLCEEHYKSSGLKEYHTWTNGTPEEISEEIHRRNLAYVAEWRKGWMQEAGVKQVEGHIIREDQDPIVYFIRHGDLVKIGTTVNLINRMKTFNLPNLIVLATEPGYTTREHELHKQFKHLRYEREWFRLEGDLLDYINGIRAIHHLPPVDIP